MDIVKFDYKLPKSRIAHRPAVPRDSSKLLVLDRKTAQVSHMHFHDIPYIFDANDVLVFNETKVIPARIYGKKETGGTVELLLEKRIKDNIWYAIGKNVPNVNKKIIFDNSTNAKVLSKHGKRAKISFNFSQVKMKEFYKNHGHIPLPPYIDESKLSNFNSKGALDPKDVYQTIYARNPGSIAAPTAGLHFTKSLLKSLESRGVLMAKVDLSVGRGTFEPVKTRDILKHKMHSEEFELTPYVAQYLNKLKKEGRRIIAVGTTTTRVLETCADKKGVLKPQKGSTNIFLYPPYKFRFIDGLITNFHLPKSTLLMLISAFVSYPNTDDKFIDFKKSKAGKAYVEAIAHNYRFYSFGDAMLII